MEKTMNTNIGHYFKHLTCTLFVVLGLMGIFATASQAGWFDTIAPTVSLTSPATGTTFTSAQTVIIAASAADKRGVSKVELYDGATLKGTDTTAPYSFSWAITSANNGNHSLTAKAYDAAGNSKVSAASNVTINIPVQDLTAPTVALTSPTSGTTVTSAQTVTIAASATDNVGVSKVELYDGTTLKGTDTTAPYGFAWAITSANNGNHSLSAKAYDAAGNNKVSAVAAVNVNIAQPVAVNPGSFEFAVGAYTVNENGGKVDVIIKRVGGSDGAVTVGFRTGLISAKNGYDYVGIPLATQSFASGVTQKIISVGIIDDAVIEPTETFKVFLSDPTGGATLGAVTESILTVLDNDTVTADTTAPTVSLSSPTTGTAFTSAQTVTITAAAADNVGVSKVELYDGAILKGTDTTAPYSFAWAITSANNGSHSFTAKAYDAASNSKVSAATAVTVNITAPVTTAKPGSFEFAVGAYTTSENGSYVDVAINRVGGSDGQVSVDFRTGLITAKNGEDYVGITLKSLVFANGETWQTQRVSIINNTVPENEETFKVLLSNPTSGATLGTVTESIISILDDDAATTQPPVISGPVKVFPGAEGFGTTTIAGRGGQIIKVTNLNDSGTGSLRAAITATGPRIVVFEVGGTIALQSKLYLNNPYITIAGQTAPFPGIQLKNAGIYIKTHDVLIQHLRIRPGDADPGIGLVTERHALAVQSGSYNVVIDHNTFQWATDENAAIWSNTNPIHDVTFSNNLIPECLVSGSYGMAIGTSLSGVQKNFIDNISIIGNLFAHNTERQPKIGSNVRAVVANNVAYNGQWGFTVVGSAYGPSSASFYANHYITGQANSSSSAIAVAADAVGSQVYLASGLYQNQVTGTRSISLFTNYAGATTVTAPPVVDSSITFLPVADTRNHVLGASGAWPAFRDSAEERVIVEVSSEIGAIKNSLIDAGGWPSDYDKSTYRALTLPANPNADDNGNGYTNIDEVLYQFARNVEGR